MREVSEVIAGDVSELILIAALGYDVLKKYAQWKGLLEGDEKEIETRKKD
jgi:hypothetical protein